jgi:hypothetical protein
MMSFRYWLPVKTIQLEDMVIFHCLILVFVNYLPSNTSRWELGECIDLGSSFRSYNKLTWYIQQPFKLAVVGRSDKNWESWGKDSSLGFGILKSTAPTNC